MKTLFIECNMGAAGDMLTAALLELLPDPERFLRTMNEAGIPGMRMTREEKHSCGLRGSHISVYIHGAEEISDDVHSQYAHAAPEVPAHGHQLSHDCGHSHGHRILSDVQALIGGLKLPDPVKERAMEVYACIAEAEAHAHGCAAAQVHFHELGMLDGVTDVCAVCLLMHWIAPERVVVSPVCTGFGQVRCMHGIVPVPAPATAYLLKDMPAYAGSIEGELLTPTGAALLKCFADAFGQMPRMTVGAVGCGMGMKEFAAANCVRVFLGESDGPGMDAVAELCCNLDDMTGETLAFAMEELMAAGALDVYFTPIQMKKGRPGVKLSCLCRPADAPRMTECLLRHTTTLGVRINTMDRVVLRRSCAQVQTPYGAIGVKFAYGPGVARCKPEYADAARAARARGVPVCEVLQAARLAAEALCAEGCELDEAEKARQRRADFS